jgi:uncharacterized protein
MELSPIIEAAVSGDTEAARKLQDDGQLQPAELNGALFSAVEHMRPEVVRLLLSHGADVNAKDEFGVTPLHLALDIEVEHSKYLYDVEGIDSQPATGISQILLEHGADINARTVRGETPLDWATESNHEAGLMMLQEHASRQRAS